VPEEQILQKPQGQALLRRFLDTKGLIYQAGDSLDVDRFTRDVLPGAVPLPERPDVFTARAIHERFLGAPGLRLLPDGGIVRKTILKSIEGGKIALRLSDDRAYDAHGFVDGPEGRRRRVPSSALSTITLDESVLVTRSDSGEGLSWMKEDKDKHGVDAAAEPGPTSGPPVLKVDGRATAHTWDQVIALAAQRPLVSLDLTATSAVAAQAVSGLLPPLGADSLSLSVTVGGALKDGGTVNFMANDLKPSHPIKPLSIAQTIFNALSEGATYEAVVSLAFGPAGRAGLQPQLQALADQAPDGVKPKGVFEKAVGQKR